ncbi:MAG TPA: 5'/3'-nucleotidase SurE [Candidatus Binatia bacterium]|nr:5'/3'-nucleotidase SurE [Candidatus Binatia bacterium]
MRILIANDDGIYSPGIATLAEVVSISPTKKNWPTQLTHPLD